MTFRTFRKIFALPSIATSAKGREAEVGPDPEYRSRLRQDSAFFLRTRTRSQKIKKKTDPDPESLFNFGNSRSLRGHFVSKNMGKLWLDR